MKFSIEMMLVQQDVFTEETAPTGIRLYGDPLHVDDETIVSRYRNLPLDEFLANEARFGIGNYALVEMTPERCRIITSPGYCGGYGHVGARGAVAGTVLSGVLRAINENLWMDPFGLCYYLSHNPKSAFYQMPFSTMFEGVFRLPPSAVIEFEGGKRTAYYSYLLKGKELAPAASFEAAMDEVTAAVARYCAVRGKKPALMFSGGVDCLSIYLSLSQKMKPEDIHVITVDHNRSNGPDRAFAIGEKLGIEIDHIEDTYTWSDSINATLETMMQKDIVSGRGPNVAILEKDLSDTIILHGQSMDAISKVNMVVLQANLDRGFLSREKVREAKTDAEKLLQYETFLANLQFTGAYLSDSEFQRQTAHFFAKMNKNAVPDPDPGGAGIFRGMISSQHPNLLARADYPPDQIRHLDIEVETFRKFMGGGDIGAALGVHLIRYYTYAALGNKRMATLSMPDGSRLFQAAMGAPILNYFIGSPLDLSRATKPKEETYALVEKITGKSYNKLAQRTRPHFNLRKMDKFQGDGLLMRNMKRIDPKNSFVIPRIADPVTRSYIEYVYRDVNQTVRPDDPEVSLFSQSLGRHILNLEQLVRSAVETIPAGSKTHAPSSGALAAEVA